MRGRLMTLALLALALHGCGSGNDPTSSGTPPSTVGQPQAAVPAAGVSPAGATAHAAVPKSTKIAAKDATAQTPAAVRLPAADTTFVPSAKGGRAPVVVFVHDLRSGKGEALAEAWQLSARGVASLLVAGAYRPTRDAAEFGAYVDQVRSAIAEVRKRPDVDPLRVALLGEATGARLAAVVLGEEHGAVRGAVLADLGAAGGGSGRFAPERWLARSPGSPVLLQRSADRDRTTDAQIRQLVQVAPPGTLVYEYRRLDARAQPERDRWLRNVLS